MFLQQTQKFRSLVAKINPTETLKLNKGAIYITTSRGMSSEVGSGAGKGGGGGGSVREAGGAMGMKGAAQEDMYFTKENNALKSKLKEHLKEEIKKHEDAIKASKDLMKEMEKNK